MLVFSHICIHSWFLCDKLTQQVMGCSTAATVSAQRGALVQPLSLSPPRLEGDVSTKCAFDVTARLTNPLSVRLSCVHREHFANWHWSIGHPLSANAIDQRWVCGLARFVSRAFLSQEASTVVFIFVSFWGCFHKSIKDNSVSPSCPASWLIDSTLFLMKQLGRQPYFRLRTGSKAKHWYKSPPKLRC